MKKLVGKFLFVTKSSWVMTSQLGLFLKPPENLEDGEETDKETGDD